MRHPHLAGCVFPRENLQGKLDSDRLSAQHQWRAALRVAEDQELRRSHRYAGRCGAGCVIDAIEHGDTRYPNRLFEKINYGLHAVVCFSVYEIGGHDFASTRTMSDI